MMKIDENDFFREATLRICGSLDIEKALHACLLYIREFIPTDQMGFHLYQPDMGIVETVAHATLEKGSILSIQTPLCSKARKQIEEQRSIRTRLVDKMRDDPVTGPVVRKMNALDTSALIMNLVVERKFMGVLAVFNNGIQKFNYSHIRFLSLLNEPFAIALSNSMRYRQLHKLRDLLADDKRYLEDELRRISGENIVGADFGLRQVMEMVRQVAPLNSPVLLLGETGVGKEVIANAIHSLSPRKDGPFIKVNCGAIPENLMDSELFGHEKGAFTGAICQKRGRFERADKGTIFLDEIGELPNEAQIRLLRVLQEKEIERVGGAGPVKVDIRVIAATHRNLEAMLSQGRFREDLYFRLSVFPIVIPPLRDRKDDIPALVHYFIQKKSREMKLDTIGFPVTGAIDRLMDYTWPGNVRELENAVERALILSRGGPIQFGDIHCLHRENNVKEIFNPVNEKDDDLALDRVIACHIRKIMNMCGGRIEGQHGAARILKIHPSTLRKRMKKMGIPFGRKAKYLQV